MEMPPPNCSLTSLCSLQELKPPKSGGAAGGGRRGSFDPATKDDAAAEVSINVLVDYFYGIELRRWKNSYMHFLKVPHTHPVIY
jgi:hypothetical protein